MGLGLATYGIFTNNKILLLPLILFAQRMVTTSIFTLVPVRPYLDMMLATKLLLQLQLLLLLLTCLLVMERCQHNFRDQLLVDSQGQQEKDAGSDEKVEV